MTYKSPSDTTTINPDYSAGRGYYTTTDKVAELLQIPPFTAILFKQDNAATISPPPLAERVWKATILLSLSQKES